MDKAVAEWMERNGYRLAKDAPGEEWKPADWDELPEDVASEVLDTVMAIADRYGFATAPILWKIDREEVSA